MMRSVPLLIVAAGALAWLVADLVYNEPLLSILALVLVVAGLVLAAWSDVEALVATGFVAGAAGMLLFLMGLSTGIAFLASLLFAIALAGAALAVYWPPAWLPRTAWSVAALASLLWIWNDRTALAWEPGNLAALAGSAWLAVSPAP